MPVAVVFVSVGLATEVQALTNQRQTSRRLGGDPHVVSIPQVAELLGISKDLAYDLARRGELPGAFQLGRRWMVSLVRLRGAVHGEGGTAPLAAFPRNFGQEKPE